MSLTMKAGVVHTKNDIRYESIEKPKLESGKVLIKVKYTGICGSDIPRVNGDACHFFPNVLGHEFSGTIVDIGSGVTSLNIGDRVSGVPLIPCMECDDCKNGNFSLCKKYSFIGSREFGSFAEYVVVPEKNAVKFDSTVSFEQGAFFEPSTVALHGLRQVDYKPRKSVAILGGGTIGLFLMQWAKIYGAEKTVVFDIENERLKLAKKLGATECINTLEDDYIKKSMDITSGRGFDYVFETAGNTITMKMAYKLAGNKAQICFVGTPTKEISFSVEEWEQMNRKEFKLTGSWMSYSQPFPGEEWTETAKMFKSGDLKFDDSFIYKKIPLSQIDSAFEMFKTQGLVKGKILIDCDEHNNSVKLNPIKELIEKRKAGINCGIPSYCSANELVIETVLERAKETNTPTLIEATANQVNQFGGYTGMEPIDFVNFVYKIADKVGCNRDLVILAGDHLGPLTFCKEPENIAMEKSEQLVYDYVKAGFTKIHLDTSMKLSDDSIEFPLKTEIIAQRGVQLYKVCMEAYAEVLTKNPNAIRPVFVIGSEVPIPGGAQEAEEGISVTKPEDFSNTVDTYKRIFEENGISDAFDDIVAVVVQPGVEFGDSKVFVYDKSEAKLLSNELKKYPNLIFEGHSTDYQPKEALKEMVEDGIAILKVGPALTFGLREALFSLCLIEKELVNNEIQSNFIEILEKVMLENPSNWENHYHGLDKEKSFARKYSFSDRCRYYFNEINVQKSIDRLFENLSSTQIPLNILHQYMPKQYEEVCKGQLKLDPRELVKYNVLLFMEDYEYAVK